MTLFPISLLFVWGCTSETLDPTTTSSTAPTVVSTTAPTIQSLPPPDGPGFDWVAVDFGLAKPYILYREDEVVLVDVGKEGTSEAIGEELAKLGFDWSDVKHVIVTHSHGANAGALTEVMELAPEAQFWIGAGEEDSLVSSVDRSLLNTPHDGDRILDLTIIETPGHTPGHLSVLDEVTGTLVDGDLLIVRGEEFYGPPADSNADSDEAYASLRKLAQYQFETILIARGDPVLTGGRQIMEFIGSGLAP